MLFLVASICALSVLHSTEAFCERKYKMPYWLPKTIQQRAIEADIVIYGNVTDSPCVKPPFIYQQTFTAAPTAANATNSTTNSSALSSHFQQLTPSANITEGNSTDVCITGGFYDVSIKVHCVIKGGPVPGEVHLRAVGVGPEMCAYRSFTYVETAQSFHVYKGLNYLIFLGRHKGGSDSRGFWPHHVNLQFAAVEIANETELQSIFAVAGGHAHHPTGVLPSEHHSICTPYAASKAGATFGHFPFVSRLVMLLCALMFT